MCAPHFGGGSGREQFAHSNADPGGWVGRGGKMSWISLLCVWNSSEGRGTRKAIAISDGECFARKRVSSERRCVRDHSRRPALGPKILWRHEYWKQSYFR